MLLALVCTHTKYQASHIQRQTYCLYNTGDRLEVVDTQQKRAEEAEGLIRYFLELNNTGVQRSAIFTDPSKVHEVG